MWTNPIRTFVRKGNIGIAKAAYRNMVIPVYRAAGIPVYDITASWELGYTWFRIPKNGTHSIMQLLSGVRMPDINSSAVPYFRRRHASQYKFCVIRNPWDRLVSVYCNKVLMELMYPECWGRDFGYFIGFISKLDLGQCDNHIRLQTAMFPVTDMNFVGRMEQFEDNLRHIMKTVFNDPVEIPHLGVVAHENYRTYYDTKTRQAVSDLYASDIAFGNYVF